MIKLVFAIKQRHLIAILTIQVLNKKESDFDTRHCWTPRVWEV